MKQKTPQLSADAVNCVVAAMTLEEKALLTSGGSLGDKGVVGATVALRKYGIPSIGFSDGPAGVRSGLETKSVWYPSITNISGSWDKELIYRVGEAIGLDGRAFNTDILLAPGMNIQKNIFGGRNFEYSSEDPILTGYLMSAYVNGVQSTGIGAEDGENYTPLYNALANQLKVEVTDLDVEARYIRIRRDGDGWFSIFELKVYG